MYSISSEVGMHLLGGKALFLSSDDIQLGTNETMKVENEFAICMAHIAL